MRAIRPSPMALRLLLSGLAAALMPVAFAAQELESMSRPSTLLFLDDHAVANSSGVERVVHQGVKRDLPVLEPTEPWEGDRLYVMGTVAYDPEQKLFRLWYMARDMEGKHHRDHLLYATSRDGLEWEKPRLGLHEYAGSLDNNILLADIHSPSVHIATGDDGSPTYKLMAMNYKARGYVTATSSDGLNWKFTDPMRAIKGSDNVTLTRDPRSGEYLSFHRQGRRVGKHFRRSIFLSVSDNFRQWSEPTAVLVPEADDDAAWVTEPQRQRTEFYNMTAAPYRSGYIGFLTVCRFEPTPGGASTPNQSGTDGPVHVELTTSRDGRTWNRLEGRPTLLDPGPAEWDGGMILALSNPLVHNDEVWIYYTGFNTTHGGPRPPKRSAIGLARWRLDGFVSLRARKGRVGIIETVLFPPSQGSLVINAVATQGEVTAELLDSEGNVIAGYSREEALPITTDAVRSPLRWQHHQQVPRDQAFAIRFYLKGAELFSCTLQ